MRALGDCRDALDRLAGALLSREQLDRAEIERAVGVVPAAAKPRRVASRVAPLRVAAAAGEPHQPPAIAAITPPATRPPAKSA